MEGREGAGSGGEGKEREGPKVTVEPGPLRALLRHCHLTYNYLISRGNTYIWEKGAYLGVSHASHPKTAEFHGSPFGGFSYIYVYTI